MAAVELHIIDFSKNKEFDRCYEDINEARKFIIKVGYSKKLKIVDMTCEDPEVNEYLNRFL